MTNLPPDLPNSRLTIQFDTASSDISLEDGHLVESVSSLMSDFVFGEIQSFDREGEVFDAFAQNELREIRNQAVALDTPDDSSSGRDRNVEDDDDEEEDDQENDDDSAEDEEEEDSDLDSILSSDADQSECTRGSSMRGTESMADDPSRHIYAPGIPPLDQEGNRYPVWKSLFPPHKGGQDVIYFPFPGESVIPLQKNLKRLLTWRVCPTTPRCVKDTIKRAHFSLRKGGKAMLGYWGRHLAIEKHKDILFWQKVNHFPVCFELGRKDKLYMHYCRMKANHPEEYDFMPLTFSLPSERVKLMDQFHLSPIWIVKPPSAARGIGIKLASKPAHVSKTKNLVASKYIDNPILIDGKKFDLRVYVLVTSYEPLVIYVYEEGIVRFASSPYNPNRSKANIRNKYIHLTNYSINKRNKVKIAGGLNKTDYPFGEERFSTAGGKWSFSTLREYFRRCGSNMSRSYDQVWESICTLTQKTILTSHCENVRGVRLNLTNSSSSYELFGFDILLDSALKPWLMEVNISPSLKTSCPVDRAVKDPLSANVLNLVGFSLKDVRASRSNKQSQGVFTSKWIQSAIHDRERKRMIEQQFPTIPLMNEQEVNQMRWIEDELVRKGQFRRIFPAQGDCFPLMPHPTFCDRLVHELLKKYPDDTQRHAFLLNFAPDSKAYRNTLLKADWQISGNGVQPLPSSQRPSSKYSNHTESLNTPRKGSASAPPIRATNVTHSRSEPRLIPAQGPRLPKSRKGGGGPSPLRPPFPGQGQGLISRSSRPKNPPPRPKASTKTMPISSTTSQVTSCVEWSISDLERRKSESVGSIIRPSATLPPRRYLATVHTLPLLLDPVPSKNHSAEKIRPKAMVYYRDNTPHISSFLSSVSEHPKQFQHDLAIYRMTKFSSPASSPYGQLGFNDPFTDELEGGSMSVPLMPAFAPSKLRRGWTKAKGMPRVESEVGQARDEGPIVPHVPYPPSLKSPFHRS